MIPIRASSSFMSQGPRPAQEDAVLSDASKGIFVLADGFGGPTPGALASKIACEEIKRFLFKEAGDRDATMPFVLRSYFSLAGNVLFNALIFANRKVLNLNRKKNVHEKGGASVIAGFIDGDLLAIANVGVCSAKMMRNGQSQDLVIPRSYGKLADPFSDAGNVDAPLMALGMAEDLEPEIFEYRIRKGDWLLFFSDGVKPEFLSQIEPIQQKQLNPEDALNEIKSIFEAQNFTDNSSISLIIL